MRLLSALSKVILLLFFSASCLFLFYENRGGFLSFSDAPKFANISRSLVNGQGYTTDFMFFNSELLKNRFPIIPTWIPPVMPMFIAVFFWFFGVSDSSVIMTSSLFFILSAICLFLLGRKLLGSVVGVLVAIVFIFNVNFLEYATSGASETLFVFEIILACYLFILKKGWMNLIGFLALILMYFTKAQAIIYIFGLLLMFFLLNLNIKKAATSFFLVFILGSAFFLIISKQGLFAVTQHLPGIAASEALRGGVQEFNLLILSKKVFYNLYNFYRLMPEILNPYLWGLFVIGLFRWYKDKTLNALKISTIFMVALTFLVTAATIPFFRYIHPITPLVYLFGVETLVWIVSKISENYRDLRFKILDFRIEITKQRFVILASSFLVLILAVGQTLGVIFLDSRFERKTKNIGKPPVYAQLSWTLRDNTSKADVIITNLDTWGSWYGERKTVWFPLEPKQLINPQTGEIPFDAVYLTSYLIDDENYYMGNSWRQIFFNPSDSSKWSCEGCSELAKEFTLKGIYEAPAQENYQREDATAVLLVKK